jgi:hypothetical protein
MCKITASAIQADASAVAAAINDIANQPDIPATLKTDLNAAAAALVAATTNWTTGSPVAIINYAAQAIEALLAAIPLTAPYAVFVGIAVAALDILIGNLGTQATQATNTVANAKAVLAFVDTLPANPWRGKAQIHRHVFEGPRSAFIGTWNDAVKANPKMGFQKLA